jgi:hypothetical protein
MIAMYRVRDAMGREKWIEAPIDELVTRQDLCRPAFEDDIDEAIRRR